MKKSTKVIVAVILLVGLTAFAAVIVHNYQTKTSFKHTANQEVDASEAVAEDNSQDAVNAKVNEVAKSQDKNKPAGKNPEILNINSSDHVYGDKNAAVKIIEYASLSCPHCADFYKDGFNKLKDDFIKTNKVAFVYRNFPLNQPALVAAMLAQCKAKLDKENPAEAYNNFVKILFKTQENWAFDKQFLEKLEGIAKLDGFSTEEFNTCTKDTKLQQEILTARMAAAQDLQIQSTPTFFVNGERLEGYADYQTLENLIKKKLAEAEAKNKK